MKFRESTREKSVRALVLALVIGLLLSLNPMSVWADGAFYPSAVTDQTPTAPLANPDPSSFQPRYISGFGSDDSFTVFFEDRDAGQTISYVSTTSGPTGFPSSATATDIADTHFVVKDWPITVDGTEYAYRAWGSVGNNMDHHFYVSNDLMTWTLVSTFTIPNASGFTDAHGWVYYGFHDVIELNGMYYAFAESNQSQTMIVRSANGDDVWEAFDSVGGRPGDGPLELPAGVSYGWTPSGSFVDLGHDRGYGKVYVDPRDSNFYLAINTVAKPSMPPADLEAAFINPANWTWHDGTTGPAANPILSETTEHDLRECWVVPNTDPDADWVIVYDADFGSADGGKALGYATLTPPTPPPFVVYVDDDYDAAGCTADGHSWQVDCFDVIQDGVNAVTDGGTVNVAAGLYDSNVESFPITIDKSLSLLGAQAGVDPRPSQGGRMGGEAVVDADETSGAVIQISASDVEINGCTITGGRGDMVEESGSADNLLFRYNILYDDLSSDGDEAIQIKYSDGVVMEYNYAYNILQDAFNLSASTNGIVRYNEAHDIYSENAAIYCYDETDIDIVGNLVYNVPNNDGIKLGDSGDGSMGGSVRDNEVHDAAEDGITVYASGVVVEGNVIYGCDSENGALYLYGADDATVAKNVIRDNDAIGLLIRGSDNVTVEENEIHDNDDTNDTKYPGSAGVWLTSDASNVVIHGNSIAGNADAGVENEIAAVVDASGNWWGTADPAEVAAEISGDADYTPWLATGTDTSADPGFQGDFSELWVDDDSPQTGSTGRIQEGIDMVSGSTVYVAAGMYDETVDVNKRVTIQGAGSDIGGTVLQSTSSPQVVVGTTYSYRPVVILRASGLDAANPVLLKDLRITPRQDLVGAGYQLPGILPYPDSVLEYIALDNVQIVGTSSSGTPESGLAVDGSTSLAHVVMEDCAFRDMAYGMIFHHASGSGTMVQYMQISDTVFAGNSIKGFYAEKLSDTTFDTVAVTDNGDTSLSPSWADAWNGGIDINLKYGDYQNLAFNDMTVTGNGLGSKEGAGLMIKARDDGSTYGADPATLDNVVVEGGTFTGNERGIRFGEPGKDNAGPTNAHVHYANIYDNDPTYTGDDGSAYGGVINHAQAEVDAECNWWGAVDGPSGEGPGSGDAVTENVDFAPWLFAPAPDGQCGCSIDAIKYEDVDGDGERDDGELGLEDWTITLFDDQGGEVVSGLTDGDGWISFEYLDAGTYQVCETLQDGWLNSDPGDGTLCKSVTVEANESGGVEPGPVSTTLTTPAGNSYTIEFLGVSEDGLTWTYEVTTEEGSQDLSHWVLGLCMPEERVDEADPDYNDFNTDPTTGVTGMKWESTGGVFSVTFDTVYPVGTTEVGVKSGSGGGGDGQNEEDKVDVDEIAGPHCGEVEPPTEQTVEFGNYRRGSITIVKDAEGASPKQAFTFIGDLGTFELAHGESQEFVDLDAGIYTVAEDPTSFPKYWTLIGVVCEDQGGQQVDVEVDWGALSALVPLESGQHLTCTFTNQRADFEEDLYQVYLPLVFKR